MIIQWDNKRRITEWGEYVRVFLNCPFRHGWIIEAQMPKAEWDDSKYEKFRR